MSGKSKGRLLVEAVLCDLEARVVVELVGDAVECNDVTDDEETQR